MNQGKIGQSGPIYVVSQVSRELPVTFLDLVQTSQAEGIRNMALLQSDWRSGANRFEATGEALFGAYVGEQLVGVGGVSRETGYTEPAMRMRRLYVLPAFRRTGVGRLLAQACIERGLETTPVLTCNAQASAAAGPFWETLGFAPIEHPTITHVFRMRF